MDLIWRERKNNKPLCQRFIVFHHRWLVDIDQSKNVPNTHTFVNCAQSSMSRGKRKKERKYLHFFSPFSFICFVQRMSNLYVMYSHPWLSFKSETWLTRKTSWTLYLNLKNFITNLIQLLLFLKTRDIIYDAIELADKPHRIVFFENVLKLTRCYPAIFIGHHAI